MDRWQTGGQGEPGHTVCIDVFKSRCQIAWLSRTARDSMSDSAQPRNTGVLLSNLSTSAPRPRQINVVPVVDEALGKAPLTSCAHQYVIGIAADLDGLGAARFGPLGNKPIGLHAHLGA